MAKARANTKGASTLRSAARSSSSASSPPPVVERSTLPIAALNPAPYNPRKISSEALAGLDASLERFGVVQEIIVNKRDGANTIVGGHQRVKALLARGVTEVPVALVDLDEIDEKALNVALNSGAISGEYDQDALAVLLEEIKAADDILFEQLRLDELEPKLPAEPNTPEVNYEDKYEIIVECHTEQQQEELFHRLTREGFTVRVMTL